jgi:hypothetical protein
MAADIAELVAALRPAAAEARLAEEAPIRFTSKLFYFSNLFNLPARPLVRDLR